MHIGGVVFVDATRVVVVSIFGLHQTHKLIMMFVQGYRVDSVCPPLQPQVVNRILSQTLRKAFMVQIQVSKEG